MAPARAATARAAAAFIALMLPRTMAAVELAGFQRLANWKLPMTLRLADATLRSIRGMRIVHLIAMYGRRRHVPIEHMCSVESFARAAACPANVSAPPPIAIIVWVSDRRAFLAHHAARMRVALKEARLRPCAHARRTVSIIPIEASEKDMLTVSGDPRWHKLLPLTAPLLHAVNPAVRSDFVRLEVVRRYGGLYADVDTMAVRDLTTAYADLVALEPFEQVNNSPFAFRAPSHPFIDRAITRIVDERRVEFGQAGPKLFTAVLDELCGGRDGQPPRGARPTAAAWCRNVTVLAREQTYPFATWKQINRGSFLAPAAHMAKAAQTSRKGALVHYVNSMTNNAYGLRPGAAAANGSAGETRLACASNSTDDWEASLLVDLRSSYCPVHHRALRDLVSKHRPVPTESQGGWEPSPECLALFVPSSAELSRARPTA